MKVAIVILNYNGRAMLEKYLQKVMDFSRDEATVYVADNASTDNSMSYVEKNFDDCRTIFLDQNYGFAEGYNRALQQINAEYYVLLNSDVEVSHHWLTPLIEFMDNHSEAAACQPKLLSALDNSKFEYAGAAGGYLDKYGYPFCRGRIFDTVEQDEGQYDNQEEIMWATGACFIIRSADYWAAGGFDERFFAHNEEIDLCWQLRLMGRKIYCLPDSYVYHVGGGTLPKSNPMKTFLNFRNNLTMLYKNLPDNDLHHVMRTRWWLDYMAAMQALILNRNFADCKAIFKARRAYRKWKAEFKQKRAEIQGKSVVEGIEYSKKYSIIWQYYVKKKTTYERLQ